MSTDDPVATLRGLIAELGDDTISEAVEIIVRGLIRGMLAELIRDCDEIVKSVVVAITDQLAAAAERAAEPPAPDRVDEVIAERPRQDSVTYTCEICGREGKRRFTKTETGWRCSPSATKCPGHKTAAAPAPAKAAPAKPAARQADPPKSQLFPDTTARCTDCPRSWNLHGKVLELAIESHETSKGHIVELVEVAD